MIFDHIGLVVRDIDAGRSTLAGLLPIERWSGVFDDPLIKVRVQFGHDASGVCYELIAPLCKGSPVDGVLAAKANILNHVAYRTPVLLAATQRLRRLGCVPSGPPRPAVAFGGRRVIFLITPIGFVLELIEEAG